MEVPLNPPLHRKQTNTCEMKTIHRALPKLNVWYCPITNTLNDMKTYTINIDMIWSTDLKVRAKSLREAKKKAFSRFIKNPKKSLFNIQDNSPY